MNHRVYNISLLKYGAPYLTNPNPFLSARRTASLCLSLWCCVAAIVALLLLLRCYCCCAVALNNIVRDSVFIRSRSWFFFGKRYAIMTVVAREESRSFLSLPQKGGCLSYADTLREMEAFLDGSVQKPETNDDVYVDITEPMNPSTIRMPDAEDPDATENSSSFGNTTSRSENVSGASDAEVESEYRVDSGFAPTFDSYSSIFPMRKKKLSAHWRSFIRPLMWRCKWTELKIKELESQALKYSRELEATEQTKMLELHQYSSDFCSKSFPFFSNSGKRKPMKRRKRKLVENLTDISYYMSHHQLFSYLENKRFDLDGPSAAEDVVTDLCPKDDKFGVDGEWFKDGEEYLDQVFRQIETVQSQVHRLKSHLDMVILKNGVKFSSSENLSLFAPYEAQTSAAQSPAFSAGDGENMSMGAVYIPDNLSDFEIGDLVLPDSLISGYKDVHQIPDIIESTVGLLSAADVTIHQPQIFESGENNLDDTHVHSRGMQEGHMSCDDIDQLNGEYHTLENKEQNISSLRACSGLVPDPMNGDVVVEEKSTIKSCLTSDVPILKNKRKRGERKAGPGGWNMKPVGEPDSN